MNTDFYPYWDRISTVIPTVERTSLVELAQIDPSQALGEVKWLESAISWRRRIELEDRLWRQAALELDLAIEAQVVRRKVEADKAKAWAAYEAQRRAYSLRGR